MSTVAELKQECDNLSIAYGKRAKKADLIKLLEDHKMAAKQENAQTPTPDVPENETVAEQENVQTNVPEKKKSVREIAGPIFNEMADAGATRAEIVEALVKTTGKSKNYVNLQYNMLADFFGKHPKSGESAPRGKKADAFVIFEKHITEGMEDEALAEARKTATTEVLKATELKKASVDMHMRAYLKTKGYQLSSGLGGSRGDTAEKGDKIEKILKDGGSRGDCLKMLVEEYGHTDAGAASTYQNIVKSRQLQGQTRAQHREPCWNWFKENLETKREDAVKQFVEIGASPVMAASYWQTFSLAKELFEDLVDVEEEVEEGVEEEPQAEAA